MRKSAPIRHRGKYLKFESKILSVFNSILLTENGATFHLVNGIITEVNSDTA
jgi:hypothetical protein